MAPYCTNCEMYIKIDMKLCIVTNQICIIQEKKGRNLQYTHNIYKEKNVKFKTIFKQSSLLIDFNLDEYKK